MGVGGGGPPMVHAVVCLTWELGSLRALRKKGSPMLTSCTSFSGSGPSRMEPKAKVAASRHLQSSGVFFLSMLACRRAAVKKHARRDCFAADRLQNFGRNLKMLPCPPNFPMSGGVDDLND